MTLTVEKLTKCFPGTTDIPEWFAVLSKELPAYNITTDLQVAAFLAQCAHESANFTVLKENLNYSADALSKIFKKYFPTLLSAQPFHRKAEDIANKVYGNRMGNTLPGDGFKYRGRGLIQVTGKENYTACSKYLYNDDRLITDPDFLLSKEGAVKSACWYWNSRALNELANLGDTKAITKKINGGYNGLEERIKNYEHILAILKE